MYSRLPPFSKNLAEEGVLIRPFKLIDAGQERIGEEIHRPDPVGIPI